ncbi:MAG TPA: AAA family ATPase [Candidatus Eisenbacteria bacterium]|nr:AAA family ATPase [Candidatus Eisenbacteria bacterium]
MRLERVVIEGFGPLSAYEAIFEAKKLNLVIGPNESGKSSFASAVVSTLFGFASHEAEALSRPWSGARHAASVTFRAANDRDRVSRRFDTHDVEVVRLAPEGDKVVETLFKGAANPRGRSSDLEKYEELLRGWLGFTDERLFRESVFVHENALETEISPELRHLVSGAVEADYQQIQQALLARLDTLTKEHPFDARSRKRTNRSIESRTARLEELRTRRARAEVVLSEVKSRAKEREELDTRMLDLRADLAGKEQLLADLDAWVSLREEQRKLLKRAPAIGTELVNARRARNAVEEIDRQIAQSLGYLANAPEEVEPDLVRLGTLRAQRARHLKSVETERGKLEATRPVSRVVTMGITILLAAIAAGVTYGLSKDLALSAGAMALGAVLGLVVSRAFGQSTEKSRVMGEGQVKMVEENIRTLSHEIDQIEIRVNPFLAGRTLEVVLADVKQFRAANQERREHAAVLHSLPMPERLESEAKEIDEAVASLRSKEKLLLQQSPFLAPFKEDPVKIAEASERLKREATALRTRLDAAQEALDGVVRRWGPESDAENLDLLDETIALEEESLKYEGKHRDALLLALEGLREAVHEYQEQHVGRIAEKAGATLARLTSGRYGSVALDAEFHATLAMGGRGAIGIDSLSRGARDAFYLSLRASLAQELAAREPLPLLLDDPVAHLDEDRRGALLALLEEMAEEVQVILFTHDKRSLGQIRAAHVVALGAVPKGSESIPARVEVRR